MSYEGGIKYTEDDFSGWRKHLVLEEELDAFTHNMESAGIDNFAVVHALEEVIKEIKRK